ncbi:MAG TPA: nitroreductase family protein [Thiotrichaceae bacterium]|nr:nitroreductase family protein [Thiotrichaceae bacterium]
MKKYLKRTLSPEKITKLRDILEKPDRFISRLASSNGFLASLYYLLISRKFDREHLSVLKGRLSYWNTNTVDLESHPLLRRNIHRLEKGLIMRPRRNIFAEKYIGETVECYERALSLKAFCPNEKKWAKNVLDNYFSVVGKSKVICKVREKYMSFSKCGFKSCDESGFYLPYLQKDTPSLNMNFEQLETLFLKRRSIRWYQNKQVPIELIQKAVDIAVLAPSACNRQPYRFLVSNDKDMAIELAGCAGGTGGFVENIPAIIVLTGDLSAYPAERDRHLIYIDSSLAAMQLMLALETLGLSSCPINWPDVSSSEKKIQNILNLPSYQRIIMLLAVGYADPEGGVPFSQKKRGKLIMREILPK